MLLTAGAATMAAGLRSDGADLAFADAPWDSQASVMTHRSGTNLEMEMARSWTRAFHLPGAKPETSQGELLRELLEPPFSFVYGDRQSKDILPTWKFEVEHSDLDATKSRQETTYTDPDTGLVVRAVATHIKAFPAVE